MARRENQMEVFRLEEARSRLNTQLDGVSRSDENFLKLVTELHEVSRQHKQAREKLHTAEADEQTAFEAFSGALRRSQAEERVQAFLLVLSDSELPGCDIISCLDCPNPSLWIRVL
ncbi:unnamed protein product [Echinostoma caproni]|uniref:ALIX_LYPXL_bnd domain-containing protein n=1 Tax=Echinostoma caproni TaxID=27848 RepID=A0A183A8H9_9TREM|nr:unnamed protein product [Echinostoma caproni]